MLACGGGAPGKSMHFEGIYYNKEVQGWLKAVVPAVVGISSIYDYRYEQFNHQMVNNRLVPDSTSPTGYLLATPAGSSGEAISDETERVSGTGLIIYRDERHAVILTNAHLVTRPDTIQSFLKTADGSRTNIMAARAIKKRITNYVIGQVNQYISAETLRTDTRIDLAIVLVSSSTALGSEFSRSLLRGNELDWGDFVYVFGNPREIKQLTRGVVSLAPQKGFFIVDAVARSGFSGGPVLVIRPDTGLHLAGMVSGVPSEKLPYVRPPNWASPGQFLSQSAFGEATAEELDLIHYGTTYVIGAETIIKFLKDSSRALQARGITLSIAYSGN